MGGTSKIVSVKDKKKAISFPKRTSNSSSRTSSTHNLFKPNQNFNNK